MATMIRVRAAFCAGLSLRNPKLSDEENQRHFGKWQEIHGHDFTVEVVVTGPLNPNTQCIMDYSALQRRLRKSIIHEVDHKFLNDLEMFADCVPSAENMARIFFERFQATLPKRITLLSLTLEDREGAATIVTGAP